MVGSALMLGRCKKSHAMRYAEIRPFRVLESHPHVSIVQIDPADHRRLTRLVDDRPELRVLGTCDKHADQWTVHVGCASQRVRDQFDELISEWF
jgi:predicted metalloprotease